MCNEFCTLFDVNYLPRGLALYRSLAATMERFRLHVYCMDDRTHDLLCRLDLPGLEPVALGELEVDDQELLRVKGDRDAVEYCWTATPAICLHSLARNPELESITYLDADLMFFSDPAPLFDEMGADSVAIVPHRYEPFYRYLEELSGTYNVAWLTFRRDDDGLRVLRWWHDRCIEWCYRRHEAGKFGDQKYLDDWPQRFSGVHVLEHPGGGLAPWNVTAYHLDERDGEVLVDGLPLVFFHYHALRLHRGLAALSRLGLLGDEYHLYPSSPPIVWRAGNPIGARELELVWRPYLAALADALALVRTVEPGFSAVFETVPPGQLAARVVRSLLPAPIRATLRRGRRFLT
jgi:hypothetical protein